MKNLVRLFKILEILSFSIFERFESSGGTRLYNNLLKRKKVKNTVKIILIIIQNPKVLIAFICDVKNEAKPIAVVKAASAIVGKMALFVIKISLRLSFSLA